MRLTLTIGRPFLGWLFDERRGMGNGSCMLLLWSFATAIGVCIENVYFIGRNVAYIGAGRIHCYLSVRLIPYS